MYLVSSKALYISVSFDFLICVILVSNVNCFLCLKDSNLYIKISIREKLYQTKLLFKELQVTPRHSALIFSVSFDFLTCVIMVPNVYLCSIESSLYMKITFIHENCIRETFFQGTTSHIALVSFFIHFLCCSIVIIFGHILTKLTPGFISLLDLCLFFP